MNYIINPKLFYLISVLEGLEAACLITGTCLLVTLILFLVSCIYIDRSQYDDENSYLLDKKKIRRRITVTSIIFAIIVITCILIPSRKDMEKMLIASYATEDNITAATNYGKDLVDYIFEKVEGNK